MNNRPRRHPRLTPSVSGFALAAGLLLMTGCKTDDARKGLLSTGYGDFPGANPNGLLDHLDKHVSFDIALPNDSLVTFAYESIPLLIVPEKHAFKVDWREAFQEEGDGYFVALIRNVSTERVEDFELDPGHVMYEWVGQIHENGARGHAYLKVDSLGRVKWFARLQKFERCAVQESKPRKKSSVKTDVSHTGCKPYSGIGTLPPQARGPFIPAGVWVSCVDGCCQPSPT